MSELTHFNARGEAHMVDIAAKDITHRSALASGVIRMQAGTLTMIEQGSHKKGDVLGIARIAGIMAAKKTADLVPLCHPVPLTHVSVEFDTDAGLPGVRVRVRAETDARTGVEMEALTAVQATLLTIYDMCKAVDRAMVMDAVQLEEKSGGRSGHWRREA